MIFKMRIAFMFMILFPGVLNAGTISGFVEGVAVVNKTFYFDGYIVNVFNERVPAFLEFAVALDQGFGTNFPLFNESINVGDNNLNIYNRGAVDLSVVITPTSIVASANDLNAKYGKIPSNLNLNLNMYGDYVGTAFIENIVLGDPPTGFIETVSFSSIPEPSSFVLIAIGMGVLCLKLRKR